MTDRYIRQYQLIAGPLRESMVAIAGVGMLGSWAAHALARVAGQTHFWDFDDVGPENIGTQAYSEGDLGFNKAVCMAGALTGLPITGHRDAFPLEPPARIGLIVPNEAPLIVVSAVDSFKARREIAEWAQKYARVFVDLRAHSTVGVVCIVPNKRLPEYLATLETDAMAPEAACGMEGTGFVGMQVAAIATAQLNQYFRGMPTAFKQVFDVATGDTLLSEPNQPERRYATEVGPDTERIDEAAANAYIAMHPGLRI